MAVTLPFRLKNMRKNGLTKSEIVNSKSLNIFYKEHSLYFKMLDFWTLGGKGSVLIAIGGSLWIRD